MNKKRIIFLNPPSREGRKLIRNFDCATESKGNYLYQPYDFLLMSAKVPDSLELVIIDGIAEKISKKNIVKKISKESPSIIVISLADSNWHEDFEFVRELRQSYPKTCLIAFGDSFIDPVTVKKIRPYVNGLLHNPIFVDFAEVLKAYDEKKIWLELDGFISGNSYSKIDLKKPVEVKFPIPKHSMFLNRKYRWPFAHNFLYTTIFTAWGCPYSCSYCIMAKFPNYYRDAKDVYEEMLEIKALGLKEFYMGDRSFGLPRNNVINLMNMMIENKIGLKWSTYFHPNQYDPVLLEKMKYSGCHTIIIGIEIANLKKLKSFGRHTKEGRLFELISHCNKIGIKICGDFILGLPGENKKDIMDTIELSKKINIDYASFNIAAPLAGSSIREYAVKEGRMQSGELEYDSFGYTKVLGNGVLKGSELIDLRNLAVRGFYFRISYLIKSLFRIRTVEQLIIQIQEMSQLFLKSKKLKRS